MSEKFKKRVSTFRLILIIAILGACSFSIVKGVQLMDIQEIIGNGSILCLACIGIG